jgi:hypothetical protein
LPGWERKKMDYRVKARVLEGKEKTLREAIETGALGKGEIFEKEMQGAMQEARVSNGLITFYEICYCPSPLQEEREYYDRYLEILEAQVVEGRPSLEGEPLGEYLLRFAGEDPGIFSWRPRRTGTSGGPIAPPDLCDSC